VERVSRRLGLLLYLRSIALLLAIWFVASLWVDNRHLMPGPQVVLPNVWELMVDGELLDQVGISMRRLGIGYGLAATLGLTLGILMTTVRAVEVVADPIVELIRPVSGIAWIPLFLAIFGVGDILPILVIFYAAFFPFVVNANAAFKRRPAKLVAAAQSLGAGRARIVREIVMPAAMPSLLTGARIALAFAWASIIAAELIGSSSGIGFSIEWNRKLLLTDKVLAWIVIVGVLGFLTDRAALWTEQRLTPWRSTGVVDLERGA
jgi:ABC-type nitrate/sulfonate/bicarbonate transport system permease component